MKLVLENVAPTADNEFCVLECLSKMYVSYRSEMSVNSSTQTKMDSFFARHQKYCHYIGSVPFNDIALFYEI